MLQILGQLAIYGSRTSIDRCASIAPIPEGTITQIGRLRKTPDADSWCYASPWYRFHLHEIDDEVSDFISCHSQIGDALAVRDPGITYAFFTLCPVDQSDEETFACVLSHETLNALTCLGVGLQIAPANVMPETPYWDNSEIDGDVLD